MFSGLTFNILSSLLLDQPLCFSEHLDTTHGYSKDVAEFLTMNIRHGYGDMTCEQLLD